MSGALRRLFALVLLALWLPATAHCAIDSVTGWFADTCESACDHASAAADADACEVVEEGNFTPATFEAAIPAPNLTSIICLVCQRARLLAEAEPLPRPAWAKNDPADWVPGWTFAVRAAWPARAPNLG